MRYSHVVFRAILSGAVVSCSLGVVAPAMAAVYAPNQVLSADAIKQFLADPAALLGKYPNGGAQLIAAVRDLAASDPATLKSLISLLKTASPDQATAIGTGLGQVALMAIKTDQAYASRIQEEVIAAQNNSGLVAFSAAIGGDIQLAAAGPGGGGGGGGGGEEGTGSNNGSGGSSSNFPENFRTFSSNTPDNFEQNFGTPTTTITQNVSPTTP